MAQSEIIDNLLLEIPKLANEAQELNQLWSRNGETRGETMQGNLDMSELPDCLNDVTRDDMEIVFFRTGSSQPSKYRNVSSIFINFFSKGSLLLDCGKGTLGQLRRRFGVKAANEAVRSLRCIWISDIHADHHTEAFRVALKALSRVNGVGKTIPGWKIVYSGDTKYCPGLVKASHGATVLIHEATFDDSLEHEANAKDHSATKDAIKAGYSSGSYHLILTHFSQRYPKIPKVEKDFKHSMQEICVAFNLMSVNLADLPLLPRPCPCLELMFKNEIEPEDADF